MFLKLSLYILLYVVVMAMENSPNCLVPLHYNLKIKVESKFSYNFSGESNATVYINCETQNLTLQISNYVIHTDINDATVYSVKGSIYTSILPMLYKIYDEGIVVFNFIDLGPANYLEYGIYVVNIKFSNYIAQKTSAEFLQTWYIRENTHKMLTILNEPRRARMLFPCWDNSDLSATFNISVEHDVKQRVLSNMPIRESELMTNGMIITHFNTTSEMSPHDVGIVVYGIDALYPILNSTENMVNVWCRPQLIPHMKFAQYVAGNVTKYLRNKWNIFKTVPKVDYVAIPQYKYNIRQTWGLVVYNEADIIYKEKLHSFTHKAIVMRSIARDIISQWFGYIFDPSCSSHWWLNEGFIMFLETYIIDKALPDFRIMDLFIVQVQHESRHLNSSQFDMNNSTKKYTNDIFKSDSLSSFSHIKGAVFWRILESVLPYNNFWVPINEYVNTSPTYHNARTPDDLWNIMETATEEHHKFRELYYIPNVREMMDIWTTQKYCPVVNVTRNYSKNLVIISKELHDKSHQTPYFIPITYTTESNIRFKTYLPNIHYCLTKSNPKLNIRFDEKDKWIIINLQQAGYYRINYDPENWQIIARYLNSEKYTNIHVLNRAQIIDDAFNLAIEKKLDFTIFWKLASYLWREKDYVAWFPMIKVFEYISNIFPFFKFLHQPSYSKYGLLKEALGKIENLFAHMERNTYNQMAYAKSYLDKFLQLELAKWACIIDNAECMKLASNHLHLYQFFENNDKMWQKWTYCNGIKKMNNDEWDKVSEHIISLYKEYSDHKMLEYLGCSEDPQIILKYLQFVKSRLNIINVFPFEKNMFRHKRNEEAQIERIYGLTANLLLSTLARHAKNTAILKEILQNFNNTIHSRVNLNVALCVIINNSYSMEQLVEINEFVMSNMGQSFSNVVQKLTLRSYQIINQLNFFESLFKQH